MTTRRWIRLTLATGDPIVFPVETISAMRPLRAGEAAYPGSAVYPVGSGPVTGNGWIVLETPKQIAALAGAQIWIAP